MARILLVEDDSDFQFAFQRMLEPRGHEVSVVGSAERALEVVDGGGFALAIVDLNLPGMDGAELARTLRGRAETAGLPLIVLTAVGQKLGLEFDERDQTWLPVDMVMDKADPKLDLGERVDEFLRRRGPVQAAPSLAMRIGERLRHVATTCPHCGCGCGFYLKVRGGRAVGVTASPRHAVSRGRLCVKGWTAFETIRHPDRLTHPLIRRDGVLAAAGWDEALELCVGRWREIQERFGGAALGVISSAHVTNEESYLAQKLARAGLKSNNVDHCGGGGFGGGAPAGGLERSFGWGAMTNSIEEIAGAGAMLVIGSNITEALPLAAWRVRRARDRKAGLVVIDPRRTDVAAWADVHLSLRPGTDLALLNALANVIIGEGRQDRNFIGERTEGFEEFAAAVAGATPERAGEICGVSPGAIREAARIYAAGKPASIIYGRGLTAQAGGAENVAAAANLALLTGNVGRASSGVNGLVGRNNGQGAGDMGARPEFLPGYQAVAAAESRRKFEAAWKTALPEAAGLGAGAMLRAAGRGGVHGLFLIGEDPLRGRSDARVVEEQLRQLDFLVRQDMFMSETCRLADVVLPAAGFAEKDGTFTNTERRVQLVRKALAPAGESRADWEILGELLRRLGVAGEYSHPAEIMDEAAGLAPIYGGISFARLEQGGVQWPCPEAGHPGTEYLYEKGFVRGKGRFIGNEFKPAAAGGGGG